MKYPKCCRLPLGMIMLYLLNSPAAIANHIIEEVPPGFKRLSNGEVIVEDLETAIPPEGYYINRRGLLKKSRTARAIRTGSPFREVESHHTASHQEVRDAIPAGFHRMPDGSLMANDPATAVVPPGYTLTATGVIQPIGESKVLELNISTETEMSENGFVRVASRETAELDEIPPGFHRMPDGTLMANNPSKAVAPEGFHLMPDGTLMANEGDSPPPVKASRGGGMVMFDYRYSRMLMNDLLDQTKIVTAKTAVDPDQVYSYMMAPTYMNMDMHMLMAMYHTRDYMLMAMMHYMSNAMGMESVDGTESVMETRGLADTVVTATFPGPLSTAFMLGVSLPTGSIDERGPMTHVAGVVEENVKYPYGMQLGSGSFEFKQGVSYESPVRFLQWSIGYNYTTRLHRNANGYRLGNVLEAYSWMKFNVSRTMSAHLSVSGRNVEQMSGWDVENYANRDMSPTMNELHYGGRRIDLGLGWRYESAKMTSLGVDMALPVHQNLFGPQMKTDLLINVNLGYML